MEFRTKSSLLFVVSMTTLVGILRITTVSLADDLAKTKGANEVQLDSLRVLGLSQLPADQRRSQSRTIISDHPFIPPTDRAEWEKHRGAVRTRVLVANGLWPIPPRPKVEPVIHGRIDRDGYTIEKVYFESLPGHYVCGNLYRPKGSSGSHAAILFPHGHFGDGRFHEADAKEVEKQLRGGGERYEANARFPAQAPLATLAKMGCVVFQYDMVGRGDSRLIGHGKGYDDAEAVLQLQSFMGLQTWNSLRSLDFLCELPDVDPLRVGVTGASGGATQTIMLCAIDDRPKCAFPAVMVSTSMQGGCACENTSLLRIGGGNVEIAALFAPKPLGMSNANDWTLHFERKGLPELRALYQLLGAPTSVMARSFPQFRHNFNQVSRELMYGWMNEHLRLGVASIEEKPIEPVMPKDLSVFDQQHRPAMLTVDQLRLQQLRLSEEQMSSIAPMDGIALRAFQSQMRDALRVMIASHFPAENEVLIDRLGSVERPAYRFERLVISRAANPDLFVREAVPAAAFIPEKWDGARMIVWIDAKGHSGLLDELGKNPNAQLASVLKKGIAVFSPDVLLTGEFNKEGMSVIYPKVSMENPRFTLCYNRSILAHRVHDVLTAVGCAKYYFRARSVDLVGFGQAGPWVVLARCLCENNVSRCVADFNNFTFKGISDVSDPMLLPGALKYGDLIGLAGLIVPHEMFVRGIQKYPKKCMDDMRKAYDYFGQSNAIIIPANEPSVEVALGWITRP